MKKQKKAPRARTLRREADRTAVKLAEARLALARLEPGGSAEHPIEVPSASVVEVHAAKLPCAACAESDVRVEEHLATSGLRIAKLRCRRCGVRPDLYFRIVTNLPS
jgi:hypothetical protein